MRYTVLEAKGNIPIIGEERGPVYELTPKPVTVGVYPPPPKPDASESTRLLSDLSEIVSLIQRDVEEQHIRVCSFGQAYIRWRDLNQARIQDGKGLFLLETLYAFLANLLLARICQAMGLRLLDQSPPDWKQIQSAISALAGAWIDFPVAECYSWYVPGRELLSLILNRLEAYDLSRVDRDILGRLYERCVPPVERRRLGLFTTPEVVVDCILEAVGYTSEEPIEGKTLLDPACGSGAFLVRAVRRLVTRCQRLEYTAVDTLHQVHRSLFGIDIVPFAVYLARLNVLAQIIDLIQEVRQDNPSYQFQGPGLFVADALDMRGPSLSDLLRSGRNGVGAQEIKYRQGRFAGGLDFVVGNPPYGKASHLGRDQLAYFAPSVYGHPNYYGLFLQLGIDLLAEGGRLGYIVPSSMTSGLYFKNLREYIVSRTAIRSVVNVFPRKKVFDDVLQGVMILALERYPAGGKPAAPNTTISEAYSLAELSDQPRRKTSVPTDRILLRKNGQLYFIFKADGRAHDLIARFFAQGYALSSPQIGYKTRTGPIVWNRVKDSLRDSPAARCLPLIWSNNVSRYGFAFEGNRFGRQAWALRGPKTESFKISQPVILVQRTTAREQPRRLVAAYPTAFFAAHPEFFVENHLNVVAPVRGNSEVVPEYVLALLNSTLYDFVFRCLNGNTQVSASELDTFPVVLTAGQSLFIEKVQKIEGAQTTDARAQVESEIDQMVFDLFGLTQSERDFVLSHYPGQQT